MRLHAIYLAALAASTAATVQAAPPPAAPAEQRLAHVSIVSVGTGTPVVLIPGLSSPRAVWAGILPQLAARHRVLAVQVNGFAGDDPGANLKPGVIDGAVADIDEYLRAHKLTGARVIGHSLGGLIALDLAKTHPGDASAVMIVDALPYVGDVFLPGVAVAQVEPQARAMRDQIAATYGKVDAAFAQRTGSTMAVTPAAQATIAGWVQKSDSRVSAEAMYEDMITDLRPDLASIKIPITLVYPTAGAVPTDKADAFYRAEYAKAPNVTFVPVAASGHFVMLDRPKAFADAVAAFVR